MPSPEPVGALPDEAVAAESVAVIVSDDPARHTAGSDLNDGGNAAGGAFASVMGVSVAPRHVSSVIAMMLAETLWGVTPRETAASRWMPVDTVPGLEVSDYGVVRDAATGEPLVPETRPDRRGGGRRRCVTVDDCGTIRHKCVDTMVARAFINSRQRRIPVHADGDAENCRASNLVCDGRTYDGATRPTDVAGREQSDRIAELESQVATLSSQVVAMREALAQTGILSFSAGAWQ